MKKLLMLSVITVSIMLLGISASAISYVKDDFSNTMANWNLVNFNTDLTSDTVNDTIATAFSSGNKALKITCKSSSTAGNKGNLPILGASSVTSGKLVYQFDYYLPNDNSAAFTQFGVSGVVFYGNYKNYITGGGITAPDNSLVKGSWNSVLVICDLDNNTLNVDVNGVNKLSSQAFTAASIEPRFDFNWAEANDIVYLDNISIFTVSAPILTSIPTDGSTTAKVNKNVELYVSQKLSSSTVNDTNIKITNENGEELQKNLALSDNGTGSKIIVSPTAYFESEKTYKIIISGLIDIYGQAVADKTITFATQGLEPVMAYEPVFEKLSFSSVPVNTKISTIQAGIINTSVRVDNNVSTSKEITLIGILKKDGNIENLAYLKRTMPANSSDVVAVGLNVPSTGERKIEIYLWDGLIGETALTGKYILDANGISYID